MWSNTNEFKIFGDGTDKLILVSDGQGFIVNNPFLMEMIHTTDCIDVTGPCDEWRKYERGLTTTDLHFKCGKIDIIHEVDLDKLINPFMNKSVLELMQIVNQKLKARN